MAISINQHRAAHWPLGARVARRSSDVLTLVVLDLVVGLVCIVAIFAPVTMHQFVPLGIASSSILLSTAAALWLFAFRLGRFGLAVATIVDIGVTSAIVSWARTPEGAAIACFIYVWAAIYAASVFDFRTMVVVLVAVAAGSGTALATNGLPHWSAVWILLVVTTWGTAIVLERSVGRLRREAETDSLTGLLNRRGFLKAVALERSVSDRVGLPLMLVALDLDRFKEVNDSGGHAAGDLMLVEATAAWRRELRAGDLLARFGGDEFVMLLADVEGDGAQAALERCREAHPIEWTAGVASVRPGEDIERCLTEADAQLYGNKERGRGLAATRRTARG